MRYGRGVRVQIGAEADTKPSEDRPPIMIAVGMGVIGLVVVAIARDESRAAREKW